MKSNWIPVEFRSFYEDDICCGLAVRFCDKEINSDFRKEVLRFVGYLRKNYFFPIKCNVHFEYYTDYRNEEKGKDRAIGIFYNPKEADDGILGYPKIKIAVFDYDRDKKKHGKEKALHYYLCVLVHELTHYYQWYFFETKKRSKRSLEIEANRFAEAIVNDYFQEVDL